MRRSPPRTPPSFTVREANEMLPLVRAITGDMVRLSQDIVQRKQRLAVLGAGRVRDTRDPYTEELQQIAEELEKDGRRLREYAEELRQLGVEPKSATEGLVDFPSTINGRPVYLCWRLGEPEVLYWHEFDAGFLGRQSLPPQGAAGNKSLNSDLGATGPG